MASLESELRKADKRWRGARIGYAGVWLLFLYGLFSAFVVLSFSAFQLQQAIHNYKVSKGMPIELRSITDLYSQWKVNSEQIYAETDRYNIISAFLQNKIDSGRDLETSMSSYYADCRGEIANFVSGIRAKIEPLDGQYANVLKVNIERSNFCRKDQAETFLNNYLKLVSLVEVGRKMAQPKSDDADKIPKKESVESKIIDIVKATDTKPIEDIVEDYLDRTRAVYAVIVVNTAQMQKWRGEQQDIREQLNDLRINNSRLFNFGGHKFDDGIGDYLTSLAYFEGIERKPYIGWFIPDFSKMPPDTLTLILVLAMGSLGGTIQLSRKHLASLDADDGQKIQPSYYLFRPFLGAITALSVFILAKAGVLVASVPSPGGEPVNLSPFFISFLGIVSGLLAEQAIETIERVGERFFSATAAEAPERWAYGLGTALKGSGGTDAEYEKTLRELSKLLAKSEDQIEKWMKEEEPVPDASQKLIAAFFHLPMRTLFTDLKG
jgi:hypothetical protein